MSVLHFQREIVCEREGERRERERDERRVGEWGREG